VLQVLEVGFLSFGKVGGLNVGPTPLWQAVPHIGRMASFSERGFTSAWPSGRFSRPGILPIATVPSNGSPYQSAAPVVGEHLTLGQPGLISRCVISDEPFRLSKQTSGSFVSCAACA
jgi:hypothetical protein